MQVSQLTVTVIGGGAGGAAAALLLARAGARVTLLERIAEPRAVGAGIGLAENGMAVLESLGLAPALLAHACETRGARIVDGAGRTLLAPPASAPRVWMIRRSALQTILLEALEAEPRVETRFGVEATEATTEGVVTHHSAAGEQHLQADLVIAADGVHSRIRDHGRFHAHVSAPGIAYLRVLVRDGLAQNVEAWTSAGLFGSFPVPDGTYAYASIGSRACAEAVARADLQALRDAWGRAYAPADAILSAVTQWQDLIVTRVQRVHCGRWADGCVALLGDAAHAMPPNLGQGANSALVDAAVLLDELRRGDTLADALRRYEARRKPAVHRVADTAARLGALAEMTHPVARAARDRLLMPLLARLTNQKQFEAVLQEPPPMLREIGRA